MFWRFGGLGERRFGGFGGCCLVSFFFFWGGEGKDDGWKPLVFLSVSFGVCSLFGVFSCFEKTCLSVREVGIWIVIFNGS